MSNLYFFVIVVAAIFCTALGRASGEDGSLADYKLVDATDDQKIEFTRQFDAFRELWLGLDSYAVSCEWMLINEHMGFDLLASQFIAENRTLGALRYCEIAERINEKTPDSQPVNSSSRDANVVVVNRFPLSERPLDIIIKQSVLSTSDGGSRQLEEDDRVILPIKYYKNPFDAAVAPCGNLLKCSNFSAPEECFNVRINYSISRVSGDLSSGDFVVATSPERVKGRAGVVRVAVLVFESGLPVRYESWLNEAEGSDDRAERNNWVSTQWERVDGVGRVPVMLSGGLRPESQTEIACVFEWRPISDDDVFDFKFRPSVY
jgi:hypothetical protein